MREHKVAKLALERVSLARQDGAGADTQTLSVDGVSAANVTEHDATLRAQINPGGLQTTYEFHLSSPACQRDWPVVGPCMAISTLADWPER